MNLELEPYIPPHPNAPKFERKTRGITIAKYTKKVTTVRRGEDTIHEKLNKTFEKKKKNKELGDILRAFHRNLAKAALKNKGGVLLPHRMGKVQAVMCRSVYTETVDPNTSYKLGYKVFFSRLKNAGKFPFVQLDFFANSCNLPNKGLWEFQATAILKKDVREVLAVDRTRFSDVRDSLAINGRRSKLSRQQFAIKSEETELKTYNEFDFS